MDRKKEKEVHSRFEGGEKTPKRPVSRKNKILGTKQQGSEENEKSNPPRLRGGVLMDPPA